MFNKMILTQKIKLGPRATWALNDPYSIMSTIQPPVQKKRTPGRNGLQSMHPGDIKFLRTFYERFEKHYLEIDQAIETYLDQRAIMVKEREMDARQKVRKADIYDICEMNGLSVDEAEEYVYAKAYNSSDDRGGDCLTGLMDELEELYARFEREYTDIMTYIKDNKRLKDKRKAKKAFKELYDNVHFNDIPGTFIDTRSAPRYHPDRNRFTPQ
jgi:hypothetical protein